MPKQQLPLISVCVPVFNGEAYILDCINSVLEQNFSNYELLIVDNCSTDSTSNIVKSIKDKRLRFIQNEENIGSINNFNKCINEAQGEYFLLLPHDDLLFPDCLEQYLKMFNKSKVGLTYSSICIIDENRNIKYTKINHTQNQIFSPEETIVDIIDNFVPIQLAMVRTKILQHLGGFDKTFGLFSDVHLWLRVAFEGWHSSYNSVALSCHRVHDQQGQKAFLNTDLKTLSLHWGEELDQSFFIKNSYNSLFLNLIKFYFKECAAHGYIINKRDTILLKLFIKLHLRSIFFSFIRLKAFIFVQELLLIKSLLQLYGFKKLLLYYPYVIFNEVKKKLINKNLVS
ncbi:glycosyltransferase [Alphaproteobacteria bacterium]|nr:glycosyltransferase [Alphaproteobacteria bacterium]MDC1023094.1 glycosyltransferase [Alphaproteobacteria bacterium]